MTENKPIIIDGKTIEKCHISEKCKEFEDCKIKDILKQLARKTQECEELKERLNSQCFDPKSNNNRCISYNRIAKDYERDLKQLNQLKAENDGLKDDIEGLKRNLLDKENRSARYYLITSHREWNEMYKKINYQRNKIEQSEQKLKQIRDIADTIYKYANRLDENNWGILDCRIIEQTKQITQIIDEVE